MLRPRILKHHIPDHPTYTRGTPAHKVQPEGRADDSDARAWPMLLPAPSAFSLESSFRTLVSHPDMEVSFPSSLRCYSSLCFCSQ